MVAADENKEQLDPQSADSQIKSEKSQSKTNDTSPGVSGSQEEPGIHSSNNLDFILDVPIEVTVELGRAKLLVNELLKLGQGSVIELSKLAGETLEVLANQKLVARGEVVVVNDKYGVRLTEVISPMERVERLR
ncbi:MAG: flagellar motor switch protein FliN [Desulfobacterales bacterium]|jgi:flagellar motor switch protein FliN/FliY|nr:MAG: flagellar motor switch protein FliN [Desulfobacterales bacterium]